jgi:hypothetical protein
MMEITSEESSSQEDELQDCWQKLDNMVLNRLVPAAEDDLALDDEAFMAWQWCDEIIVVSGVRR